MKKRKIVLPDYEIRKLRWHNRNAPNISIPTAMLKNLNVQHGDTFTVMQEGKKIILEPVIISQK